MNVDIADMIYNETLTYDTYINGEKSFWSIIQHHKSVINFITKYTGRLLTIDEDAKLTAITDEDKRDFKDMAFILMTDPDMKLTWEKLGENYIVGILIKKAHDVDLQMFQYMIAEQLNKEIPLKFQEGLAI